jgi:hypothetical protein
MGLTIHYKAKFQGTKKQLVNKLTEIHSNCLDKPFEEVSEIKSITITKEIIDTYHFWQDYCTYPNNSTENLKKRDKALEELGADIGLVINLHVGDNLTENRQVVVFDTWAGEGCENTELFFVKNKTNNTWYAESFCKTQYAEHFIRCHLLVIELFDMLKENDFDVVVDDEGEYWETRSLEILAKSLNDYTGLLLAISDSLKKQFENSDYDVVCEIDKSQNIMIAEKDKTKTRTQENENTN